jgi:hypothetical protein
MHHIAVFNGREVTIDYVPRDQEFRVACQRVRDNLEAGNTGIVIAPNGKRYEISTNSRTARLVREERCTRKL